MLTRYLILVCCVVILAALFSQPAFAQDARSSSPKPPPAPLPAVTKVRADKNTIVFPCPKGYRSMSGSCPASDPNLALIKIEAATSGAVPDDVTFEYSASGGNVIGNGPNATWDVSELKPGKYELSVSLVRGSERSASRSISVYVHYCPDCEGFCECPSVTIRGPEKGARAGDIITFTAEVSGGSQDSVTYNWTVSAGEIVDGQATPSINVRTNPNMAGKKVSASLQLGGLNPSCNCQNTHSSESPELAGGEMSTTTGRPS